MRSLTRATVLFITVAAVSAGALAVFSGCEQAAPRLNAPPQGQTDHSSVLQDNYVRMSDNAMLNERSMSPAHFVPGSAELNSLGARRLNRYAALLKVYGGPLHYDGVQESESFAQLRVDHIKEYLVSAGLGPDNFTVDVAMAGGADMRADEASAARASTTGFSAKGDGKSVDKSKKDIIEGTGKNSTVGN